MKTLLAVAVMLVAGGLHDLIRAEPWSGAAKIKFSGTSTLHSWSGTVTAEPFAAQVAMDGEHPKTLTALVEVKAKEMDTAKADRDAKMHEAMKVDKHPLIRGHFTQVPFSRIMPDGRTPATLPFTLELLGRKVDVLGRISNWKLEEKSASFDLDFSLSLKKCGISVPAVMVVVRVGDEIKVRAAVTLVRGKS